MPSATLYLYDGKICVYTVRYRCYMLPACQVAPVGEKGRHRCQICHFRRKYYNRRREEDINDAPPITYNLYWSLTSADMDVWVAGGSFLLHLYSYFYISIRVYMSVCLCVCLRRMVKWRVFCHLNDPHPLVTDRDKYYRVDCTGHAK